MTEASGPPLARWAVITRAVRLVAVALFVAGCAQAPPLPSASEPAQPTPSATSPAITPTPTASPTPPPTASPSPTPASDLTRLLDRVPESLRGYCVGVDTRPLVWLATVACDLPDGSIVNYELYGSADEMRAAYRVFTKASRIEPDTGNCARPETWPAESYYTLGAEGERAGRLLCMVTADVPTIHWTRDDLAIMAIASRLDGDAARLWQFWQSDSGPD
jgi:hypothetical protein